MKYWGVRASSYEFWGHNSSHNRGSLFLVTQAFTLQSTELEAGVGAGAVDGEDIALAFMGPW